MLQDELKKNSVLVFFAITLLSMYVFLSTLNGAVNYIRYLYVAVIAVFIIAVQKKIVANKAVAFVMGCFILHTLIFGFLLAPEDIADVVIDNGKEMLVFWLFIFFTAQYVWQKGLEKEFIMFAQLITSLFVNYCYVTNFNGIGPIKFLPSIFGIGGMRIRFTFGLGAVNRAAYIALASLVLSIIVWRECFDNKRLLSRYWTVYQLYVLASVLVAILVMLSTQTRGALLSAVLFWLVTKIMNKDKVFGIDPRRINWKLWSILILGAFFAYAYYVFFYAESRTDYLTINMDIFSEYANRWMGMGYAPFSAFLTQSFGYETGPMDCYYLYILCTTGIIGLIIVLLPIIFLLINFVRKYCHNTTNSLQNQDICLYLVLLYISFSECALAAPLSPYSYIYWILFFLALYRSSDGKRELLE